MLIITNVPLHCGILIVGEAVHVRGHGVYGNCVLSVQFFCEAETALKEKKYIFLKSKLQKDTF